MSANPVIIDASFMRSCPSDGAWLGRLVERGYDLVVSDHLVFELCSGGHPQQWAVAQRKLAPFVNNVHAWHSTGVMLRIESQTRQPFPHPNFEDSTARLRDLLRSNPGFLRDDIDARTVEAGQIRDIAGPEAVYRSMMALRPSAEPLSRLIRCIQPEAATPHCEAFVQNDNNVRVLFDMDKDFPPDTEVDSNWLTWHVFRAHLAIFCEYIRQGNDDLFVLSEPALRRWVNRTHDCDYVTLLAYGNALASQERSGEQYWFRRWIYGLTRPQLYYNRELDELETLT